MRTRARWASAAVLLSTTLLVIAPAATRAEVDTSLPARVVPFQPHEIRRATFPGIDYGSTREGTDDRHSRTTWRVVEGTGNCCETYVTIDQKGRLYDFGGTYVHFTDDRGKTWRRVTPLTPLINGEGTIAVAPGGDIVGVGWDPYSGDHLQSYKYEASTSQWLYTEMPHHEPFYDREWVAVIPGPITIDGETVPYVALLKGGVEKEPFLYSTDGLNYQGITSKALEQMLGGETTLGPLPTAAHPRNDWIQPNTNGRMTPLGKGGALAAPDLADEWALLDGSDFSWSSYRFPADVAPEGLFQVDSAGRIHNVIAASDGESFRYRISSDGGTTWRTTTAALPSGMSVEEIDFRANHAAGVGAVAVHAADPVNERDQDLVFKLDITDSRPFLARRYEVGRGDVDSTAGVGSSVRMDFQSIAIFPDGRVAVSFIDSKTNGPTNTGGERITPAIAIEQGTELGGKVRYPPVVEPELGEVYAAYDFEDGVQGWTTSGVPTWTRQHPGTASGSDDLDGWSFSINGPTQYVDLMNSRLTSPQVQTEAGDSVLQFWLKNDTEEGFDYVIVEWSRDASTWHELARFAGPNPSFPAWDRIALGFQSVGGPVQVRFRFLSDTACSAGPSVFSCDEATGSWVDRVAIGKQAP